MILSGSVLTKSDGSKVTLKDAMMKDGQYLSYDPISHMFSFGTLGKVAEDFSAYPVYRVTMASKKTFLMSKNAKVLAQHQNMAVMLNADALDGKYTGQPVSVKTVRKIKTSDGKDDWTTDDDLVVSVERVSIKESKKASKEFVEVPYESRDMLMRLIVVDGVLMK